MNKIEANISELKKLRDENLSLQNALREKDLEILRLQQIRSNLVSEDLTLDIQSTKKN